MAFEIENRAVAVYSGDDMKMESRGLLISLSPMSERDAVARIFSRDFGVLVGVMRAAVIAKKNKPLIGQLGGFVWNARLDSQLGVFHWEAEKNIVAPILFNQKTLACMNACFDILSNLLPERESYADLYDDTIELMCALANGDTKAYLTWEISLLRQLGYALDLSKCSGCGCVNNLQYLSPRTGRAVCVTCAAPYVNKLYRLPLTPTTTLCFLDSVCMQQGVRTPLMRKILKID